MRLAEIVGNNHAWQRVSRLLRAERLPPALILDGPAGVGRRTGARAIAQAILCPDKQDGDACGVCNSCRLMDAGNHPDFTELDPNRKEQELKVEPVREQIVDHVFQSPLQGNGLVFVIPDAQRLNPSAANALLKVMEEPPAGVHFILTASNSQSLLPTIRSRAPMLRLRNCFR